MDRRTFLGTLAGGLLAAPLAAEGQPGGKPTRIGLLDIIAPSPSRESQWDAFRQRLRELDTGRESRSPSNSGQRTVGPTTSPASRTS